MKGSAWESSMGIRKRSQSHYLMRALERAGLVALGPDDERLMWAMVRSRDVPLRPHEKAPIGTLVVLSKPGHVRLRVGVVVEVHASYSLARPWRKASRTWGGVTRLRHAVPASPEEVAEVGLDPGRDRPPTSW